MSDNIELNDDGIAAYCDFCKQNKPAEGFKAGVLLFYGGRDEPSEYGQQCRDCQEKERLMDEEMAKDHEEEIAQAKARGLSD